MRPRLIGLNKGLCGKVSESQIRAEKLSSFPQINSNLKIVVL